MKTNSLKILVAIAWPYVNGNLHVGHLAGYLLPADVFARFQRLKGHDVLMVSGSDCHGTPITVEADKREMTPQEVVEEYHQKDIELFQLYKLSYNLYTKTTTDNHKKVTQELFLDLLTNGYIVKDTMKQYYSAKDDKFLPDRYVEGTCPHCNANDQRSDQCENCGRWLKDGELINPLSKLTGEKVELKDSQHYFLDFPRLEKTLKSYINGELDGADKSKIWREWVYKETKGWLNEGLQKRAITRDIDWAIDLPEKSIQKLLEDGKIQKSELLDSFKSKKIYVWFEAVIGYLSASREWSELKSNFNSSNQSDLEASSKLDLKRDDIIFNDYAGQSSDWKDWWLNSDSRHYYFMGQDNLVFHTLMWPSELLGSKKGYNLPYNVVVNKFMNFNDAKFSKSRGNIIDSRELAQEFGVDAVRYFIISNLPENKETNFTWERFIDSVNNELVGNLGNFINRTLVFYKRNFENGILQDKSEFKKERSINVRGFYKKLNERAAVANKGVLAADDGASLLDLVVDEVGIKISRAEFVNALNGLMDFSHFGNEYFTESEIWSLKKSEAEKYMYFLLNIVEALRILIRPFFPDAFAKLSDMLGVEVEEEEVGKNLFEFKSIDGYPNLKEVKPLFAKIDKDKVLAIKLAQNL